MDFEKHPPEWLSWVVISANIIAFADLPYGYFQLLRLIVTGFSVWVAYALFSGGKKTFGWIFIAIAILYNPLFKIHMERETHQIFNALTAAVTIVEILIWKRSKAQN